MFARRPLAIALIASALAGCGARASTAAFDTGTPYVTQEAGTVEVRIENGTTVPLRLYTLADGVETALGRVAARGSIVASFPRLAGSVIRLVARPAVDLNRDRSHVSEPINILNGHHIAWQLHPSPAADLPQMSTVRVFACETDDPC